MVEGSASGKDDSGAGKMLEIRMRSDLLFLPFAVLVSSAWSLDAALARCGDGRLDNGLTGILHLYAQDSVGVDAALWER